MGQSLHFVSGKTEKKIAYVFTESLPVNWILTKDKKIEFPELTCINKKNKNKTEKTRILKSFKPDQEA